MTQGWSVTGANLSPEAISKSRKAYPDQQLEQRSTDYGPGPEYRLFSVIANPVVDEHVYVPKNHARTPCDLVDHGGTDSDSGPYQEYVENLALGATCRMDWHFTAFWGYGATKVWPISALTLLITEACVLEYPLLLCRLHPGTRQIHDRGCAKTGFLTASSRLKNSYECLKC
jgi:hypothetical protein